MNHIKLWPPCLLVMKDRNLNLWAILKPSFLKLLSLGIFIKARRNINSTGNITDPNKSKCGVNSWESLGSELDGRIWRQQLKAPFYLFSGTLPKHDLVQLLSNHRCDPHVTPQTPRRGCSAWSFWVRHLDSQTVLLNLSIADILFNI